MLFYMLFAVLLKQLAFIEQGSAEAEGVYEQSYIGVIELILGLQEMVPPMLKVPFSNITGLTSDVCNRHSDCQPPRLCIGNPGHRRNCRSPRPPLDYRKFTCRTSTECDMGELCAWEPHIALDSGWCSSSRAYQGVNIRILDEPFRIPTLSKKGRTGDQCFLQSNCHGKRSCLGLLPGSDGNLVIDTNDVVPHPSICTPLTFISCLSATDCTEEGEVCALATSNSSPTMLPPLCLSETLAAKRNVILVPSSNFNVSDIPLVNISEPTMPTVLPSNAKNASTATAAFSVPALSVFNSFTTNELANDYIAGILSVIILSQLRNIFCGLIYASAGIHYRGYSSYIIFSRMESFRHLCRLIKRSEPYSQPAFASGLGAGINVRVVLLPLLAITVLYAAEFGTIISGSQTRSNFFAEQGFDPVISVANGIPRPRQRYNENCDDFFVPTRGLQQRGKVLKCVEITTSKWDHDPFTGLLLFTSTFNPTWITVQIFDKNGGYSAVEISTSILSVSGNRYQTIPIRLDLMSGTRRKQFLNGFLNGVRRKLGYSPLHTDLTLWSRYNYIHRYHSHGFNVSVEEITDAVVKELREMDLLLNSSGRPWVLTSPLRLEQLNPWVGVVKPYRVAHGWLLILAVAVTTLNVITNTFATHFDEVAYAAMKELIGDVCTLGPIAVYEHHSDSLDPTLGAH